MLPARLLLRPRAQARPAQPIRTNSLRSKILMALGLVLIPAALIACIWAFMQDKRLHELKINSAARAAQRSAQDISTFLRDATLVAGTQFSPDDPFVTDPGRCQERMNDIMRQRRDYGFAALLVDDALVCFHDTGGSFPSDAGAQADMSAIRGAMADQLARSISPAFARSPDGRYLMLGVAVPPGSNAALSSPKVTVVFALRVDVLNYTVATPRLGIDRGVAIVTRQGEVIVQSSSISPVGDWFPKDGNALTEALVAPHLLAPIATRAWSGAPSHYFTAVSSNPDLIVLTGYPDALLFATERSVLISSLLPPLIMLVAATAGILWAVERLVVRWITYLQRVTRVYGSGRLSARALHIGDAPREIAELGTSFNRMADNIANHALQRERASEENRTLLRELHHRVKNNFQVIVSLLSLQKQAAATPGHVPPATDGEGLRFIEDHVQAMSIAYRVGYSSGDLGEAPPAELMHDVIDCLRRSAGLEEGDIIEEPPAAGHVVDLDRAIGIALYLAAALPAYLDALRDTSPAEERPKVRISAIIAGAGNVTGGARGDSAGTLRLSFSLVPAREVQPSPLQDRLARAYIRQLGAETVVGGVEGERTILLPLASARSA